MAGMASWFKYKTQIKNLNQFCHIVRNRIELDQAQKMLTIKHTSRIQLNYTQQFLVNFVAIFIIGHT